jgi:hypothetical protein
MLAETIKLLAQQQNEGTYPTAVLFGTVKAINPLKVQIDSKIIIEEFIVIVEQLTKAGNTLEVEDKVVILRQQGGKKYIILDRIGG